MPTAVPTWRKVLLIPEAAPARRGSTTPIAAVASGGLMKPIPTPADEEAGEQRRPVVGRSRSPHQEKADPDEEQPGAEEDPHRKALRELARNRGGQEGQHRDREEAHAGLERRVAEHVLHVEDE